MAHTKGTIWLFLVLTILVMVFIFTNSLWDIPTSKATSERVQEWLTPFLERFVGEGNVTQHLVRKMAHVVEFAMLGVMLAFFCRKLTLWPFFLALVTGLADETIQIYSGRGPQVQDVWIDFAGACLGIGVTMLTKWLWYKRKRKQTE